MKDYFKIFFCLFLTALLLFIFPLSSFAYPAYTANPDLVIAGPYDTAASGIGNWGSTSVSARDFIVVGQKYRIRQNGTIQRVKLYTASTADVTGFYVTVWRKDGSTYDLVGMSNNIANQLASGDFATVDLSTPITGVQEGDFYGARMEWSASHFSYFSRTEQTGVTSYYYDGRAPTTDFNWKGQASAPGSVMPIELYMQAPQAIFIGDSIIMGSTAHTSYLSTTLKSAPETTIEYQLSALTGYTYQNMGIGGQTTSQILARFTADAINLKPRIVVIEGGVNDISRGGTKSTFISNWTSMLDAAQADSSITTIIVLKILPWTNGSMIQMRARDDWNSSLTALATGYSKAIVVDASSYVGQFRAGGDEGNLWDIQPAYNQDGVHFNQAGHTQIARAIADNLPKPSATFDNDFSNWNKGNMAVNYNLIQTGGSVNSNIFQTEFSGIEYSTDGSIWNDATQGSGGDGLTGLISTASPGTDHVFVWNSATDLPTTEDDTVYLRIRPNDGIVSAEDWVTSNAFALDNVAPSSVGVPTFGMITPSSIEVIKPDIVTEGGTLSQWQARRNSAVELGLNATTITSVTDVSLLENTQYMYDVQFNDGAGNISSYGASAQKYTLVNAPTNFFASSTSRSVTLTVDSFPNDTSGQSGYYFSRSGANSGWIKTNSWTDRMFCVKPYKYSVKYRNGDGIETSEVFITNNINNCRKTRR